MAAPISNITFLSRRLVNGRKVLWQNIPKNDLILRCECSTVSSQIPGSSLADQFRKATETSRGNSSHHVTSRTKEHNPTKHSHNHVGLHYTVSKEDKGRWMSKLFRPEFNKLCKSFNETSLMIRKPSVDILSYMKQANYDLPAIRYVLYGESGTGKESAMAHVMHYCGVDGWLIFHVPWGAYFSRYAQENQMSSYKEGRIDQPLEAADLIANFRRMNEPILQKLDLRCTRKYVWTKRDIAEIGTPLSEIMDFALMRIKYATDILGVVLREIRLQAASKRYKLLVAVDGANAFWGGTVLKRIDNVHKYYDTSELTIPHQLKKCLKNDWTGGAVVCTVTRQAGHFPDGAVSDFPRFLLGKEGFQMMDPFLPVHVSEYSEKEAYSCLQYYLEKKWLTNPKAATEDGRKELLFLSQKNPLELFNISSRW